MGVPDVEKPAEAAKVPDPAPAAPPAAAKPDDKPPESKPKTKKERKKEIEEGFDPDAPTPPAKVEERLNIKEIIQEAVSGTAAALKPRQAEPPKVELPVAMQRRVESLALLEKSDPAYKGIADRATEFYRKGGAEDAYKEAWLKANPGQEFDNEDEAHDAFYEKHDPLVKLKPEELEYARDLWAEKRAEEIANGTISRTLKTQEVEGAKKSAKAEADTVLTSFVAETLKGISPAHADLVTSEEKFKTLAEFDPLANHVIGQQFEAVSPLIEGAVELFSGVNFDEKNRVHIGVEQKVEELQERLLKMGASANRGQQRFVPLVEYMKLPQKEQPKYWTIGKGEIVSYLQATAKSTALAMYSKLSKGRSLAGESTGAASAADAPKVEAKADPAPVPSPSPSVGSSFPTPAPGTSGAPAQPRKGDSFFKSFGVV